MSELLVLLGIVLTAASGVPGLLLSRQANTCQRLTTALVILGTGLGLTGVGIFWATGESRRIVLPWAIAGGTFDVAIDGLSALFLLPILLVSMLGSIYGLAYWKQSEHPSNGRKLQLFYGLMTAGMALVVIAHDGILFLVGWEIMALSAFFAITTEDDQPGVRDTGWLYFVATHISTLCLFGLFAVLRSVSGSFTIAALKDDALTPSSTTAIFVLAAIGFGLKAGIMPLHVWLPSAHAVAPSHVSALMSGVIIKMGIYGLVRTTSLFAHPPLEWGTILLCLGALSGVLGVAFAIGQHDLKRLLAYHSIENIGIIVMGIGLALIGRSLGNIAWIVLGLSGALLHVWNHALFKALLFLGAGSVIHAVRTRQIDELGGLAKRMPSTALCFLIGAVAICGLPPLNGFISEFFIYLGLFDTLGAGKAVSFPGAAFATAALALIGALAVACFVKVYGAVFLGTARSEHARHAHESATSMLAPMTVLASCCFVIGLLPALVVPALEQSVAAWAPELFVGQTFLSASENGRQECPPHGELVSAGAQLTTLAPIWSISIMAIVLTGALLLAGGLLWLRLRTSGAATGPSWGCGYADPSPRMQYTSSSFAQMLVGLFSWALRPRTRQPAGLGLFPTPSEFHSDVPDTVLDDVVLPTFRFGALMFSWFRVFQRGTIQAYLLYIFLALIVLLLWR